MAKTSIEESTAAYEQWLRQELGRDLVEADLATKHEQMAAQPFPFLRATYWRWAEMILRVCPELAKAPSVLAVGDIHLENFGTWRDVEGRLIWGVNDYDEAHEMPYALDLVRLGVSAALGTPHLDTNKHICAHILEGYRAGLKDPHPIVLDQDYGWMRSIFVVNEAGRQHFWQKIDTLSGHKSAAPPKDYVKALRAALPDPKIALRFEPRTAGLGSLGRPRFVGIGDWKGGRILREAKAALPSAWSLFHGRATALHCYEMATGRYRAPDPWYDVRKGIVVRRLSPNNRKLDTGHEPGLLASPKMLHAMGHELAAIHLGGADRHAAIEKDLRKRKSGWLYQALERAAAFVRADQAKWKRYYKKWTRKHGGKPHKRGKKKRR